MFDQEKDVYKMNGKIIRKNKNNKGNIMAKVSFGKDGQLINAQTGQVLSKNINGKYVINSDGSEYKTLQEMGVKQPQIPQENDSEEYINYDSDDEIQDNNSSNKQNDIFESYITNKKEKNSFNTKKTKYEVKPDSCFVIQFGLEMKEDGRFIPIKSEYVDEFMGGEKHWVKFRMWTYSQELQWKQKSVSYNSTTKSQFINQDKLNEIKIRHLMKDWSFGIDYDRLKLLHCDGVLSDESFSIIKGFYPSIINTIINLMNNVLENNQ